VWKQRSNVEIGGPPPSAQADVLPSSGDVAQVTEMESETGVAGALHGALTAGALATTFTSSQVMLFFVLLPAGCSLSVCCCFQDGPPFPVVVCVGCSLFVCGCLLLSRSSSMVACWVLSFCFLLLLSKWSSFSQCFVWGALFLLLLLLFFVWGGGGATVPCSVEHVATFAGAWVVSLVGTLVMPWCTDT
jgi:Pyruvate flavodoxin/ferredoxin oxidoreductase, thiamine diP-bdg